MFLLGLLLSFGISFEKANCTFTGNWIIMMQRFNGTLDFNRGWIDYRNGFGDIGRGEFWLGNEKVHAMTSKPGLVYQLRIEVQTNESWFYANYANFSLDSEDKKYALHVSGFSGNAGDSMTNTTVWSGWFHNGMNFSTPDADNDKATTTDNCAAKYSAGWWYNDCWMSCLTCPYGIDFAWESLIHLPSRGRLGAARMMIKST